MRLVCFACMSPSTKASRDTCAWPASRGQPQRYPDPSLGQVPGQYQVNLPAASPSGQQEHPRPFTSLMQGHAGIPSLSMHGQPGGTQAGSQANMYSPGVPGNGMAQPRPQSGVPHMVLGQQTPGQGPGQTLGQQLGLPKAVPGQLQYHPPLGESRLHEALSKHCRNGASHNLWRRCTKDDRREHRAQLLLQVLPTVLAYQIHEAAAAQASWHWYYIHQTAASRQSNADLTGPAGGQQRPPYQHYTSPPLTVQQIQQLQHLQAQQQQQLQMRASGSQQMRPAGAQRGGPPL